MFSGADGSLLRSFAAFGSAAVGGVHLAMGDVNGDGLSDIIVGAGAGGSPQVRVFSGRNNTLLANFLAYESGFHGGVFVAAGDFDGDGKADIIAGSGASRTGEVKVFRGTDARWLADLTSYSPGYTGGIRVAARDLNGDGCVDLLLSKETGATADTTILDGATLTVMDEFLLGDPTLRHRGYWS